MILNYIINSTLLTLGSNDNLKIHLLCVILTIMDTLQSIVATHITTTILVVK